MFREEMGGFFERDSAPLRWAQRRILRSPGGGVHLAGRCSRGPARESLLRKTDREDEIGFGGRG